MREVRILRRSVPVGVGAFPAGMPDVLRRIYRARGVEDAGELAYELSSLSPPDALKDLDRALSLLWEARERQWSIVVVGDYDADGATALCTLVSGLGMLGYARVDYRVPSRFTDGYGLTPGLVSALLAEQSVDLIITVDNGIASVAGVATAKAAGCRVLVTDHHLPGEQLPEADAILNPNQPGCGFPSRAIAGVGVAFYLLLALRRHLRERGVFSATTQPNLAVLLDLVALGTVADVVPLDHLNRTLVAQGLKRLRAGQGRPGIRMLLQVAGKSIESLSARDLGFTVGPRLNAAGRLEDMSHGIECLLSPTDEAALPLALVLHELNNQRRDIEASMRDEAFIQVEAELEKAGELPFGLVLYQEGWHQGVIGIVAARIKERWHRPVVALAADEASDGLLKGSARSIDGFHLRDALVEVDAAHPGMLVKFGGHAMAAGLTLRAADLEAFRRAFDVPVRRCLTADDLTEVIRTDGPLQSGEMSLEVADALASAGPWGQHFPEPLFDGEFDVLDRRVIGKEPQHLKLKVRVPGTAQVIEAVGWGLASLHEVAQGRVQMVYRLEANTFNGRRSPQLVFQLVRPALS